MSNFTPRADKPHSAQRGHLDRTPTNVDRAITSPRGQLACTQTLSWLLGEEGVAATPVSIGGVRGR